MEYWIIQFLNGITFGMVLFLVAAGLSLISGLLRIVNLAHGSFYLLGAYVAFTVNQLTNSFILAIIGGIIATAIVGMIMERFFLRPLGSDHSRQILLTLAFVFIFGDLALIIWGGEPYVLSKPSGFEGSIKIGDAFFPSYRLFMILIGLVVVFLLWLFMEKTRIGALIRAGVDDAQMAQGVGININLLFTLVFTLGAAISALGGVMAAPIIGFFPGLEWEILLLSMAVLLIGGQGSLKGAFIASVLVGLIDTFGRTLFPVFALFIIFALVALVLAFRPTGLFGKP